MAFLFFLPSFGCLVGSQSIQTLRLHWKYAEDSVLREELVQTFRQKVQELGLRAYYRTGTNVLAVVAPTTSVKL